MVYVAQFQIGTAILGTAPLTTPMLITCWSLGVFSIVVNAISKKIPKEKFAFMRHVNLESDQEVNAVSNFYNRTIDGYNKSVENLSKKIQQEEEEESELTTIQNKEEDI